MAVCNLHWVPSHIEVGERVSNKSMKWRESKGKGEGGIRRDGCTDGRNIVTSKVVLHSLIFIVR